MGPKIEALAEAWASIDGTTCGVSGTLPILAAAKAGGQKDPASAGQRREVFCDLASAIFGKFWQRPAAIVINRNERYVRRIAAGTAQPCDDEIKDLIHQADLTTERIRERTQAAAEIVRS